MEDDDEPRYFSFWEMLAIAIAPAVIEHLVAPLLIRQVDPDDVKPEATPERKRARAKAAARGFATYVTHEKGACTR